MGAQGLFAVPQSKRPSRAFIDEGRRIGFTDKLIEELWFMSEGATPAPMPVEAPPLVPGQNMPPLPVPKPETLADVFRAPLDAQDQQAAPVTPDAPAYTPNNWVPDPIERGLFGIRPQRQGVSEQALGASDYFAATGPAPTPAPVEDGYPYNPMQYGPGTIASMPQVLKDDIAKRALQRIESGAERAAQGQAVLDAVPVGPQQQNIQDAMQNGGVLPTLGAFARNPSGAGAMLAESIGSQPGATASGALTMVAPLIGAPLTLGAATQAEREASVLDQLQRAGVNTNDPQAIRQFAQENPGSIDSIDQKALTRGAAIAAGSTIADLVSGGLGKTLVGKLAKDAAVGTAADASTEMLGQVITDGGVYSGPDVVAEAVLGGGQQVVQGGTTAGIQAANQNIQARAQEAKQTTETLADAIAKDMAAQSDAALPEQAARNTAPAPEQRTENPLYTVDPKTGEITLFVDGRKPEQNAQPSTGSDYQGTGQTPDATPTAPVNDAPKVETLADVLNAQPDAQGDLVPGQNIVPGPQYQGSGQTPDAAPTAPKQTPAQQAQEPIPATAPTVPPAPVVADNATSQPAPAPVQTQQPEQSPATFAAPEGISPSPQVDPGEANQKDDNTNRRGRAFRDTDGKLKQVGVREPDSGRLVDTEFEVVEYDTLVGADGELQSRDRTSIASDANIRQIAANLDPYILFDDPSADRGAPIVGPDNVIESGNGRVRSINIVYEEIGDKAQAYRNMIEGLGFDTTGMSKPVLIRRRTTEFTDQERVSFTQGANKDDKMASSVKERAKVDAGKLTGDILSQYEGGKLDGANNRGFAQSVIKAIASTQEMQNLLDGEGELNNEAYKRVEGALLHAAYGDPSLVDLFTNDPDNNVKSIGNALKQVAPSYAYIKALAEQGTIPKSLDISQDIVTAVKRLSDLRKSGTKLKDYLSQTSIDPDSEVVTKILESFYRPEGNAAYGQDHMVNFFKTYVDEAQKQANGGLLAGVDDPAAILDVARAKQTKDAAPKPAADQNGLFSRTQAQEANNSAGQESLDARTKSASKPNVVSRQGIAKRSGETGVRHLFGIPLDDWNAMGFDKKLGYVVKALRNEYGFASIKMDRRLSKQTILDQALDLYGNFEAMTDVLGVSRKAISLNGKIGLTFQNEPRAGVIGRFTYKKNRNDIAHIASVARNSSFAHEWWHAIDNFLVGQVKGKLLSENLPNRRKKGNDPALEIKQAYSELLMALFDKDQAVRVAEVRDIEMQLEEIDNGGKGVTAKRKALQSKIDQLHASMNTDIGNRSKGDMKYTGRIAEMTARAFEATIADWMLVRSNLDTARGIVYEGLTDLDAQDSIAEAYPSVEDRRAIDNAFKRVMRSIIDDGLLETNAGQSALPRETTTSSDIAERLPEPKEPLIHDPVREMHAETEQELVRQREAEVSLNQRLTRQQKRNRMLAFGDTRDLSLFNVGKKGRAVFGDLRGRLLALRRLGGTSAKLKRVIDLIVDAPGSGRNQRLTVGQARKKAGQQFAYDVDRVLRRANISKQEMPYVYTALDAPNYDFNRVPADMRNAVRKKTGLIRDLFSDLLARQNYAVNRHLKAQVGPNIMASDSYVPGVYDMLKIAKDYQGFQDAAAKDYADDIQQRVALNHSVSGANGILTAKEAKRFKVDKLEDLTPDVIEGIAQDRAEAWVYAIKNDVGQTATTSSQHHTKSRSLLPTARKNTAKFRIQNVNVLARAYAEMAADVTAWYETVGPGMSKNGTVLQPKEHLEQLIENALADIGDLTSKADRDLGAKMLRYVAGLEHGNGYSALEEVHQLVTSVMLVKTAATQITEAATMILAEGDVGGYFKHLASQLRVLGNHAAPRWLGNKRAYTQYIEEIGALAGVGAELQMSLAHQARAGLDPDAKRPHSGGLAKLTQASYRYSLMAGHMMMMQRLGAVHAFNRMLRLAKSYKKGNLSAFNKTELKDLGIYDDFDKVADELVRLGNNPSPRDLRESKYFQQISDAMHVYVANHFLEPTRLDKPMFASENGFGRLWWSLSSYSSAFNSRVLKVAIKRRAKAAEAGATEAALNSITLTTQFAGFVVFGTLVQRVLVAAANGDMDKLEKLGKDDEEAWAEYVKSFIPTVGDNEDRAAFLLELVSYSDILGPLGNKALEIGTGARYKQDPLLRALPGSATFLGASISKRAEAAFGRNSENTDTVEHKIWRADYNWLRTFYHLGSVSAVNALTGIPVPNSTPAFLMRAAIVGSNFFVHGKKARDMAGDNFGGVTTKFKLEGLNPEHRYGTKNTKSSEKSSNKPRTYADLLKGD